MKNCYIVCHMMTSIDGRIDCEMTTHLQGTEEYYDILSSYNLDATISGKNTAAMELTGAGYFLSKEIDLPIGKPVFKNHSKGEKLSIVCDTHGSLLWETNQIDEDHLLILTSEKATKEYLEYLDSKCISYIAIGESQIDLEKGIEILNKEFHVHRIGVVGGGRINAGFLKAHLLDEISILIGPGIDARKGMTACFDGLRYDGDPYQTKLKDVKAFANGSVWLTYTIEK